MGNRRDKIVSLSSLHQQESYHHYKNSLSDKMERLQERIWGRPEDTRDNTGELPHNRQDGYHWRAGQKSRRLKTSWYPKEQLNITIQLIIILIFFTISPFHHLRKVVPESDSPLDHFTISLLHHIIISPFHRMCKNIDTFQSSYHITTSEYHDFTISPRCYKCEPMQYNKNRSDKTKNVQRSLDCPYYPLQTQ